MSNKVVKAYCKKSKKHFGLILKEVRSAWKVIDFIEITPDEATVMTSEIRQSSFRTDDNLLACSRCGGRTVSGCACAPKSVDCRTGMKYNFQCIYCSNLEIDYTRAKSIQGIKAGETIRLSQGQEVKIQFDDARALSKIRVGIGWDPVLNGDANMDVDSSVIVSGQDGQDIVYFSNLSHPSGCVVHHGDNLTGKDIANSDDENITVYLDKVPYEKDKLIFVLNIYNCMERHQTLTSVSNMYIRLYDPTSKVALVEYNVESDLGNISGRDTGLVIGMAYRDGGEWSFRAIGKGIRVKSVHEMASECAKLY